MSHVVLEENSGSNLWGSQETELYFVSGGQIKDSPSRSLYCAPH